MKRKAAILLLILVFLTALDAGASGERAQVGTDVSGFSGYCIDGAPITGEVFAEYEYSAVTYFATWSPDCLRQLDILAEIYASDPEYGVFGLLRVDATSTPEAALAIMQARGYTFPVIICSGIFQDVAEETFSIPQTYIISGSGVIVESWQAAFSGSELLLLRLLRRTYGPADGDADLSGEVNSADALFALRCALGITAPTAENLLHGDLNDNSSLDSEDALFILRFSMNLTTHTPGGNV